MKKTTTQGLNFINVLRTAFTLADPKKDTDDLIVFFTLWGSTSTKAAHRRLVKLTQGWPFNLTDLCLSLSYNVGITLKLSHTLI